MRRIRLIAAVLCLPMLFCGCEKLNLSPSPGQYRSGVYTSRYAGIACNLGEAWNCQTTPVNTRQAVCDLQADSETGLTSVNIIFQRQSPLQQLICAATPPDRLVAQLLSRKDTLQEAYRRFGYENISIRADRVCFLGQDRAAIRTQASIGDMQMYTVQIIDCTLGAYDMVLTVTSLLEDCTQELLALFRPL